MPRIYMLSIAFTICSGLSGGAEAQDKPAEKQGTGAKLVVPGEIPSMPKTFALFEDEIKNSADLSIDFPPIGSQGNQGSCVGFAVGYAVRSQLGRLQYQWQLRDVADAPIYDRIFSPAFIYNQLNGGQDKGIAVNKALELLLNRGCAFWSELKYDSKDYHTQPTAAVMQSALAYKISTWNWVTPITDRMLRFYLSEGYAIPFVAKLDPAFSDAWGKEDGFTWVPNPTEIDDNNLHAMVFVGFDKAKRKFKFANSWSAKWGDKGFAYLNFDDLRKVTLEAYTLKVQIPPANPLVNPPKDGKVDPQPAPQVPPGESTPQKSPPIPEPQEFQGFEKLNDRQIFKGVKSRPEEYELSIRKSEVLPADEKKERPHPLQSLSGTVTCPTGLGSKGRVVVYFFTSKEGSSERKPLQFPVGKFENQEFPKYKTLTDAVAARGPVFDISKKAYSGEWAIEVPRHLLGSFKGEPLKGRVLAEPVLLVDNLAVLSGKSFVIAQ